MSHHEPEPSPRPELEERAGDAALGRTLALVRYLRTHCAWDRAQTPLTLVPHLLEEAHEVVEAIRAEDAHALEGELGDLLLNLAFQVVLAEEAGRSGPEEVYGRLEEKMVRRHPHLFGGPDGGAREDGHAEPEPPDWEALKAAERPQGRGVLEGLVRGLDPLLRAYRIQERVAGVGFDWEDHRGALEKVSEELDETRAALDGGDPDSVREEIGDLLFAVVNLARLAGVHPDGALTEANAKFTERFERLEALAEERGVVLGKASLEALDALWEELKRE